MTRRSLLIVALTVVATPAWTMAARQTATPEDGKREFIVSGCLLRNGYAGYLVDEGRVVANRPPHLDVKSVKTVASSCT